MTRTCAGDSEPLTTRALLVSSPSSAPCPWDSMKAGIRFSSTCPISQDVPTVPTTLKLSGKEIKLFESTAPSLNYTNLKLILYRVQIHANCRIRRIYFSDRLYTEDELPPEFKLFLPVAGGQQKWANNNLASVQHPSLESQFFKQLGWTATPTYSTKALPHGSPTYSTSPKP